MKKIRLDRLREGPSQFRTRASGWRDSGRQDAGATVNGGEHDAGETGIVPLFVLARRACALAGFGIALGLYLQDCCAGDGVVFQRV